MECTKEQNITALEKRMKNVEIDIKHLDKDIVQIKLADVEKTKDLQYLKESLDTLNVTMRELQKLIADIKDRPSMWGSKIVFAFVSALVGGIAGYVLKILAE